MSINKSEQGNDGNSIVNTTRIKKTEPVEQIINNILLSKIELGITLYPYIQFFKSYLLEIKPKYLVIDCLMPFFGNKILPKSEYLKIHAESSKYNIDRYFFSKYKDEIIIGEDINFLIYKPIEIVIIEKRKNLRVLINNNNAAYIYGSYRNNDFFYPVYDLSWNGISFNADFFMESGLIIENNAVKFSDKIIHMDLKIIHSTNIYGKYRTGCYIVNMSDKDRDLLVNFILEIERQNINSYVK